MNEICPPAGAIPANFKIRSIRLLNLKNLSMMAVFSAALAFAATGVAQDQADAPSAGDDISVLDQLPELPQGTQDAGLPDPDLLEPAVISDGPKYATVGTMTVDRFEVRQVFANYMAAEQYPEAIDAAAVGLELARDELGEESLELVPYINDLGNALLRNDQPGEARIQFEKSVALVREQAGVFDSTLVEPLVGLGLAFQDMGEHPEAITSFQYAQHVTHRDKGVNNLDQVRIIEAMTSSFEAQEQWLQAENLQLLAFKLYKRNYGEANEETLPGMYRLARWYQQVQDYRQARIVYRNAMEKIAERHGEDSPEMIPALKGIAGAYLEENGPDAIKGLRASKKILDIMVANPDQFGLEQRILAHLEMGDWYVQFNEPEEAWEQYRSGWQMAQADAGGDRDWGTYFDRPHLIYPGATLGLDIMGYGRVGDEVYYDFEFTIARTGRPEDINILGTNLHGQTRAPALQAFRYARFRPRIVEGDTVATPGYKVRRVYPTEAPEGFGSVQLGRRG